MPFRDKPGNRTFDACACLPTLAAGQSEEGLTAGGLATVAVALWMAVWWLTEAVPLAVTALLPVLLFPLLGIADIRATTAPYANPLIFLFLGGFLLGLGIQRFGWHRRIALRVLLLVGSSPRALIGGFMLTCALLSMWISNTATAWLLRPMLVDWTGLEGITDAGIAMCGALSWFLILVDPKAGRFAMDWPTARNLPWEVLILFGGGLSLAAAVDRNGVDPRIASGFIGLGGLPPWVVALAIASVFVFLTRSRATPR